MNIYFLPRLRDNGLEDGRMLKQIDSPSSEKWIEVAKIAPVD